MTKNGEVDGFHTPSEMSSRSTTSTPVKKKGKKRRFHGENDEGASRPSFECTGVK